MHELRELRAFARVAAASRLCEPIVSHAIFYYRPMQRQLRSPQPPGAEGCSFYSLIPPLAAGWATIKAVSQQNSSLSRPGRLCCGSP